MPFTLKKLFQYLPLGVLFFTPLMVLVGWVINNPYLTRIVPQFTPMNPITAICFFAIAVFFTVQKASKSKASLRMTSIVVGMLLVLVGGIMSLKYLFGIDLHIDRLLFQSELGINRMAPATAANLLLIGLALLIEKQSSWIRRIFLLVVVGIGSYAMSAYVYNFVGVYGQDLYNPMAIHTALLFVITGLYLLILEGREGVFSSARWGFFVEWFENLRVTRKFIVGFGMVLAVVLFFTLYALVAVHKISKIYSDQENSAIAGQIALQLEVDTLQARAVFEQYLKTGEPSYLAKIATTRAIVASERTQLRQLSKSPETIRLLDQYEANIPQRIALSDKIIALISAKAKPAAYAALVAQRDAGIADANILLTQILEAQQDSLDSLASMGQKEIRVIVVNFIFLSLIVFVLILLLSYAIARSIIYPVDLLKKQAERLAVGDFTARNTLKTHDDMGSLAHTINLMTEALGARTQELQQAKAQDEAILLSIGDAVFAIDAKKKLLLLNPVAEAMVGIRKDDAIGKLYSKSLRFEHEDSGKENTSFIKTALSGKKTAMENHTVLVSASGQKIPVADSASPLIDDEGKVMGAVVVFRDVTHEREIEQAKNEFVSLASHQLRTPLTSIKWYSELLLDEDTLTQNQKEYAQEIQSAMVRMNDLVASLLDVSRLDLGTFIIEPVPTDLISLMTDTAHEQMPTLVQKNQTFIFNHPKTLALVPVDPKLMRIIVQNLISNAHKYSPEGSTITLSLEKEKNESYLVRCADTGYGIPLAQQGNVFSKLFRADNIRTLDVEGTGLGLYIIKTIVDAAGCSISFTSTEGQGTVFSITLPKTGMRAKQGNKSLSSGDTV
jgi:PAS domain S-box-containing protein